MKRRHLSFLFTLLLLVGSAALRAQENPVRWTTAVETLESGSYRIVFTARIEAPWHMYDLGPYEGGPNATAFTFAADENFSLEGPVTALTEPLRKQDEIFDMEIGTYGGEARFAQTVKLKDPSRGAILRATVEWMACDASSCLPPEEQEFSIRFGPEQQAAVAPVAETGPGAGKSLWGLIVEAILWGLAALLTPCVFPMVPMTVSFFLKQGDNPARSRLLAAVFGGSIVGLYTLPIGLVIGITSLFGGEAVTADIFNWLATHWLPNVVFFLVFLLFALSFFGAFEITLPNKLVSRSDAKADKGGLLGAFFMALTGVLVSFSCTGPIIGTVLIKSTSGEIWAPVITMLAFSVAFALPFTALAFFPAWLNKLPKSGSWLGSVKVVLGFLELALGLKFLSVADQTYHWGILDREVYLALWIAIFALLGVYLLGKIRIGHDSEVKSIGPTRLLLATGVLAFVVYLIPGMWGAPLKGLSGYLPPMHTQDFVLDRYTERPITVSTEVPGKAPRYSDFLSLPHGLSGFFDYEEAMEYARKVGKPLLLDYTGHGCVNCREMEARVWSDPGVLALLRDRFVILALYSDDKKTLPESDWVTTPGGKTLKSLGKINAYLAHHRFGVNSQPYYLILDGEGEPLAPGRGYDLNVEAFTEFLETGLRNYAAGSEE